MGMHPGGSCMAPNGVAACATHRVSRSVMTPWANGRGNTFGAKHVPGWSQSLVQRIIQTSFGTAGSALHSEIYSVDSLNTRWSPIGALLLQTAAG